ncbi:MAG: hypothetical protein AAFR45_11990 [Pseudomonadota bacterium]
MRLIAVLVGLVWLAGCTAKDLNEPPVPLGDFKLGHNIVIASKMQQGPISRKASEEDWVTNLTEAFDDRFGRYAGEGLYHFGVSVEGFMLAPPGVPLVYTPKSALIINVTVWDDGYGRKLNDEPRQFTIVEDTDQNSLIIGSGIGRSREEQLDGLSYNAAKAIENWLVVMNQEFAWFTDDPVFNPDPEAGLTEER